MLFTLLFVGAILSFAGGLGGAVDPTCEPPTHALKDASTVKGMAFSLSVPHSFSKLETSSTAEVMGWSRNGDLIGVEYGATANDLSTLHSLTDVHKCVVHIGKRAATLLTGRGPSGEFLAVAHWPRHEGEKSLMPLTVGGQSSTEVGQRELLAIIWSVQFPSTP